MEIKTYKPIIKKHLVGLLMLLAASVAIALVAVLIIDKQEKPVEQATTERVKVSEVSKSQIPTRFPSNLPLETNAEITQNYNATDKDGAYQATREFASAKTLAENYAIYSQFIKNDGWELVYSVDEETRKVLIAKKPGTMLQVTITESSVTGKKLVNISLTDQLTAR